MSRSFGYPITWDKKVSMVSTRMEVRLDLMERLLESWNRDQDMQETWLLDVRLKKLEEVM